MNDDDDFFQDMDANSYLFNLKEFAITEFDAVNFLGAQCQTFITSDIEDTTEIPEVGTCNYYKADSSGFVQDVISDALSSNFVSGQFHVALNRTASLEDFILNGRDEFYWSSNALNGGFDLAQVSFCH